MYSMLFIPPLGILAVFPGVTCNGILYWIRDQGVLAVDAVLSVGLHGSRHLTKNHGQRTLDLWNCGTSATMHGHHLCAMLTVPVQQVCLHVAFYKKRSCMSHCCSAATVGRYLDMFLIYIFRLRSLLLRAAQCKGEGLVLAASFGYFCFLRALCKGKLRSLHH